MIGLRKTPLRGKEKRRRVAFRSFGEKEQRERNLSPFSYQNCDCRGGVLHGGIGVKKHLDSSGQEIAVGMPSGIGVTNIFFTTLNKDGTQANTSAIYTVGIDGYLYMRRDNGSVLQKVLVGANAKHCAMKTEKKIIYNFFCGSKGAFCTLDGATFKNLLNVDCLDICVCGKRCLILTKNGELFYSAALQPLNMGSADPNGMGIIYLPVEYGSPKGMKEYGGKAYIFFEKGICRLTVSAIANEHVLEKIPYNGGEICLGGQATTSDGILFLAKEGVYYLRNGGVERICEYLNIGPCKTNKNCTVGYCDDVVIFSYYKNGTVLTPKRVAVYMDGKDGYFTDAYGALGGNAYTYIDGKVYRYEKDCEDIQRAKTCLFTTELLDFEGRGCKRLKTLSLRGVGSVTVTVKSEKKERSYSLVFKNGIAKTKLREKGDAFSFAFEVDAGSFVSSMDVEYVTEG